MPEEDVKVAISSEDDVLLGDSSQLQQQEITVDHPPNMSTDELLKVIKGINGMPVLLIPSGDGRLAVVAVDGLQNLVPKNHAYNGSEEKQPHDFRAWLLLITSLVTTITFTAGLTPPGGFWANDDKEAGYIAGTSVMSDKFPRRYRAFDYCNTTAFSSSLIIIAILAKNMKNNEFTIKNGKGHIFLALVGLCFLSLEGSYIAGTWISLNRAFYTLFMFFMVKVYIIMFLGVSLFRQGYQETFL